MKLLLLCFSYLPDALQARPEASVLAVNQDVKVVRRYLDYQKQLSECAGNDNNTESRPGLLQTLALLYGATQGFRDPKTCFQHLWTCKR